MGETFNSTINSAANLQKDLLVLFGKPRHDESRFLTLLRMHSRLAEMCAALPRRPAELMFARIDASRNELPVPWDQIERTSLFVFPSGRAPITLGPGANGVARDALLLIEWLEPFELSLKEVIHETIRAMTGDHARNHLGNLLAHMGADRLFGRTQKWYEDPELLARASVPYDPIDGDDGEGGEADRKEGGAPAAARAKRKKRGGAKRRPKARAAAGESAAGKGEL